MDQYKIGRFIAEKYPGTAFIDGDWCMDLHPFVGNQETKDMAVDNILHMIGNYQKCSACHMVVLVWLMELLSHGWLWMETESSAPAEWHSWRSRRISAVRPGGSGCFPACIPIRIIAAEESQRNC